MNNIIIINFWAAKLHLNLLITNCFTVLFGSLFEVLCAVGYLFPIYCYGVWVSFRSLGGDDRLLLTPAL